MKPSLSIIKPGIIFGNIVTLAGGFFLATDGQINFWLLASVVIGMSLVVAAGCVLNNVIDKDIDRLMERTKKRVLAQGLVSEKKALLYALVLGVLGFLVLAFQTNLLTVFIAFVGLFFYVVLYSLFWKRKSPFGTIIGGIAGAVPPVVGYTAVTNHFDAGAIVLFFILFFWQMPHFYAIAIYRLKDYSTASIPVLPVVKDISHTKKVMLVYAVLFAIASIMPVVYGYIGMLYFVPALAMGLYWVYIIAQGFKAKDNRVWARKVFLFSIINITLLSILMIA